MVTDSLGVECELKYVMYTSNKVDWLKSGTSCSYIIYAYGMTLNMYMTDNRDTLSYRIPRSTLVVFLLTDT